MHVTLHNIILHNACTCTQVLESFYDMSFPGTMDAFEVHVFVKYSPELHKVVNPEEITASLFASGLLSENEKDYANNLMHTRGERMTKLLEGVKQAIQVHPAKFNIFLDIMGTTAKYRVLVDKMRRDLKGVMRCVECKV